MQPLGGRADERAEGHTRVTVLPKLGGACMGAPFRITFVVGFRSARAMWAAQPVSQGLFGWVESQLSYSVDKQFNEVL